MLQVSRNDVKSTRRPREILESNTKRPSATLIRFVEICSYYQNQMYHTEIGKKYVYFFTLVRYLLEKTPDTKKEQKDKNKVLGFGGIKRIMQLAA